ncbi:hypothetical protein HMPREF1982_02907 [Clostridiales bacterium oral taxon 876 str. F0540]|nr:hypothetical protein HMPREF1982_02907 [Clostridiales bacterium oral taxon 876 str. F0540]
MLKPIPVVPMTNTTIQNTQNKLAGKIPPSMEQCFYRNKNDGRYNHRDRKLKQCFVIENCTALELNRENA